MNKKHLKLAALVLALAMIVGLGLFANALVGNPVSRALATRAAKKRMAEQYPSYTLERVTYSFKDGNYHAFFTDPHRWTATSPWPSPAWESCCGTAMKIGC